MRTATDRARRPRALLVAVAVTAIGLTGGLTALPASAAPARPHVKVATGDRAATAAWSAVPGAASYTVRLSTARSLAHPRTVTTTKRSAAFRRLVNGRSYYVGVTANRPGVVAPAVVRSSVVRAVAAKGVPFPVSHVAASAGAGQDQVQVTWTGGGRANKVAVIAGSDVVVRSRTFHSAWYPATTRSITITVPAAYRAYLGGGTGNPVWVKVVQSNSASTAFGPNYSYGRKYRPSPIGEWAFAKAVVPAEATTRLKVAELNTQSVGATTHYSATNQWSARAERVAAEVNKADPDLLTTAELATNLLTKCQNHVISGNPYACRSRTQVADLARRLDGLKLAGTDAYDRVLDRMRAAKSWNGLVTNGAHVFYDPEKLTLLDHGYFSPAMTPGESFSNVTGLGVSPWDRHGDVGPDRWLSWAKLETKDGSGRQFFAVAGHFPVGPQKSVVLARQQEGQKLLAAIDRMAGNLPVVLGADMNSDPVRSPRAPQVTFMRAGWFDAAATPAKALRTGMKVSTANGSGAQDRGADPGYGARPVKHPYETSRIDYILLKGSPHTYSYANRLEVHGNGAFVKSLQGTDHNMQLATIGIASAG